jgi:hypothetical protein
VKLPAYLKMIDELSGENDEHIAARKFSEAYALLNPKFNLVDN